MGVDMSIMKMITKSSRASSIASRDSDTTLDISPKTPSHGSRQRSK